MSKEQWSSSEVLAFTERDGPGRPPEAPKRWMALTVAGALGVVFTGVLFTDTLCAEHRAWVEGLATVALAGIVVAIVGLLRDWAGAPIITAVSASLGVSMGLIDAVHSPTRGRLVALAFGMVVVLAALLCTPTIRLLAWDRKLRREARPLTASFPLDTSRSPDSPLTSSGPTDAVAPPPDRVDDTRTSVTES